MSTFICSSYILLGSQVQVYNTKHKDKTGLHYQKKLQYNNSPWRGLYLSNNLLKVDNFKLRPPLMNSNFLYLQPRPLANDQYIPYQYPPNISDVSPNNTLIDHR